jgi:hypothetical protein
MGCTGMASNAQSLRDLLSLARMLRRFAEEHGYDANRELFVATAVALEARAHFIATVPDAEPAMLARDIALHAPVNVLA